MSNKSNSGERDARGLVDPKIGMNVTAHNGWGPDTNLNMTNLYSQSLPFQYRNGSMADVSQLDLDKNGYLLSLPDGEAVGRKFLWLPAEANGLPNASGTYSLIAEGEGRVDIIQKGPGGFEMRGVKLDGKTIHEFDFTPNGRPVEVFFTSTDPQNNGNYISKLAVIHKDNMQRYEAEETFTKEFIDSVKNYDTLRFMKMMNGNDRPIEAEGKFDPNEELISFNEDGVGMPFSKIIELCNITGVNPMINVPLNASDKYIKGMAKYAAEHLDPRLTLKIEYGNENWAPNTGQQGYLEREGLKLGGMAVTKDGDEWVIAENIDKKFFVDDLKGFMEENGYKNMADLREDLGIDHDLFDAADAAEEYLAMRGVQVAIMFEEAFDKDIKGSSEYRVENILATRSSSPDVTKGLLEAAFWAQFDPKNYSEPGDTFESLATGAYFGGGWGREAVEVLLHFVDEYGFDGAVRLVSHYMTASLDEDNYIEFKRNTFEDNGGELRVDQDKILTDVEYSKDLTINVFRAIIDNNDELRQKIFEFPNSEGSTRSLDDKYLIGENAEDYIRLVEEDGVTVLKIRPNTDTPFQAIVKFDRVVNKTVQEMIKDGTLIPRTTKSDFKNDIDDRIKGHADAIKQAEKQQNAEINFITYEAGSHVSPGNFAGFQAYLADSRMQDFQDAFNKSPEKGELLTLWVQELYKNGLDFYNHFDLVGGDFGVTEYIGEEITEDHAVYHALNQLNREGPNNNDNNGAHLHGIMKEGNSKDNTMHGTREEDSFYGNGGDDKLIGYRGDDRIHGGNGADTLKGGDGNDTIVGDGNDPVIYGGDDYDKFKISYGNKDTFNFTDGGAKFTGIEFMDLSNLANNRVMLDARKKITSDGKTMIIQGEKGDVIILDNAKFIEIREKDGVKYDFYRSTNKDGQNFLIERDIKVDATSPLAKHDHFTVVRNGDLRGENLLGNDAKGVELQGSQTFKTFHDGEVVIYDSGNFVYTPDQGFSGTDSFSYAGEKGSKIDHAIVTIGVIKTGSKKVNDGWHSDQRLSGSSDDEFVFGRAGNDTIDGGKGHDYIDGGSGSDNIKGGKGADTIDGGSGSDKLYGNDGYDRISGGIGHDTISGGRGNDTLDGGDGNDEIDAGKGDDLIIASNGKDVITTGLGKDTIEFNDFDGKTIVTDFEDAHDTIRIHDASYGDLTIKASGKDTKISWDEGDLVLEGTDPAIINRDDFDFI